MKINSRLIIAVIQQFFKSLNKKLTCPVRPGKYNINKFAIGDIPFTPKGIILPDLKMRIDAAINQKEKGKDIFIGNITVLAVIADKKKNIKG